MLDSRSGYILEDFVILRCVGLGEFGIAGVGDLRFCRTFLASLQTRAL